MTYGPNAPMEMVGTGASWHGDPSALAAEGSPGWSVAYRQGWVKAPRGSPAILL